MAAMSLSSLLGYLFIYLVAFALIYWLFNIGMQQLLRRTPTPPDLSSHCEEGTATARPPSTVRPKPQSPSARGCPDRGRRGLIDFEVEVTCARQDLHSGSYGGSVPEALSDLTWLLSQLTDSKGDILVKDITEGMAVPTTEERKELRNRQFNLDDAQKGLKHPLARDREEWLLAKDWKPSLSIHGIEGAFDGAGEKTVIPARVKGKISIRTGLGQKTGYVAGTVDRHLRELFRTRKTPNRLVTSYQLVTDLAKT